MSENTIKFIKVMLVANLLVSALLVVFSLWFFHGYKQPRTMLTAGISTLYTK